LKTLICGDLMASVGTIIVAQPDGDMIDYMASLRKVRALKPRLLFPAHGPPVAALPKIDEHIAHREARERAIYEALPSTIEDIVPRVYTDVNPAVYPLAEVNVRAHLEKLVREQRVVRDGDRYARA
jgi:glyoxylase-like metal-dependent hydrolase (beta-lactamase superfamily II)